MKYQIDDIDRKILSYLVKNARVPFLEIARECGISGAAIHQRVKKMEDAGIIEGSRFIVKPRALGFKICAFIGHYSFFLKIRCNSHQHLMDILINTLQNIPGIAKTESFISLDQLIEKQVDICTEEQ